MRTGGSDGVESRAGRGESVALDGVRIEVGAIEVTGLLFCAARGRILWKRLRDVMDLLFGPVPQFSERAPGRAIRGNLAGVEPLAGGVAVEVVSGLDRR